MGIFKVNAHRRIHLHRTTEEETDERRIGILHVIELLATRTKKKGDRKL